jgi:hypothetical protein
LALGGSVEQVVTDLIEHPAHLAARSLQPHHERQRERAIDTVSIDGRLTLFRRIDHQGPWLRFRRCREAAVEAAAQRYRLAHLHLEWIVAAGIENNDPQCRAPPIAFNIAS